MSGLDENDFPPLEAQPFLTEEGQEIERLRAELAAAIKQRDEAMDTAATHQRNWYEAKTEFGAARAKMRAELAAAIKDRDGLRCALEEIANQDYRGNRSNESLIAQRALHAMRKQGGGAC